PATRRNPAERRALTMPTEQLKARESHSSNHSYGPTAKRKTEAKSGSAGTVDLDPMVAAALRQHVRTFPPVEVGMVEFTAGPTIERRVPRLFHDHAQEPVHGSDVAGRVGQVARAGWPAEWVKWRERAGRPKEHGGFHALRHFFATTLITNHADPKEVQRALRHRTLQITLETYVHFWPRRERRRGVVGDVLRQAAAGTPDQT
ncbi:tyrosine-type recombinase/integrase, partial [Actinoplanes sp. NBRC 103695]|uniref:tyrosine-type recombinase/integrase n=1 Tax=Actinoplanes sp. NBRC 103695 TaxID=3032202 RepID=UPI0025563EC0